MLLRPRRGAKASTSPSTASTPPPGHDGGPPPASPAAVASSPRQGPRLPPQLPLGWARWALPLLCWTLASSGLIVVNKVLMVDRGFRFPLFLTAAGQAASAAAGSVAAARHGKATSAGGGAVTGSRFYVRHVLPTAACAALTLFLGNFAYLHLSMAFIQILKACTPAATFLVGVCLGLEPLTPALLLAVTAISAGTGFATLAEASGNQFSLLGFSAFMASVATEATRVLLLQRMLGGAGAAAAPPPPSAGADPAGGPRNGVSATAGCAPRLTPAAVNAYLGPPTALLLLAASAVFERRGLVAGGGLAIVAAEWRLFAVAVCGSVALNSVTYWAIQATSGLTLKIAGCVKNVLVVLVGVLQGEHVSLAEMAGYGVSMAGFAMYMAEKHRVAHRGSSSLGKRVPE